MIVLERLLQLIFGGDDDPGIPDVIHQDFNVIVVTQQHSTSTVTLEQRFNSSIKTLSHSEPKITILDEYDTVVITEQHATIKLNQ